MIVEKINHDRPRPKAPVPLVRGRPGKWVDADSFLREVSKREDEALPRVSIQRSAIENRGI